MAFPGPAGVLLSCLCLDPWCSGNRMVGERTVTRTKINEKVTDLGEEKMGDLYPDWIS